VANNYTDNSLKELSKYVDAGLTSSREEIKKANEAVTALSEDITSAGYIN
jgi:hypothetical protein